MTSTLPNEILIMTFLQLNPTDQKECKRVCHRWNQLIEDYVLYHTVFILSLFDLKRLLQKIQERPDIANKIERLFLYNVDKREANANSRKLLTLTPNLKVLYHASPTVLKNNTQYPWCNQIEYISEDTNEVVADYLFSFGIYPNLKKFEYYFYGSYYPVIQDASGLTSLVLKEVELGFDDLEEIHKNAPNLKSLKFYSFYYEGGDISSEKSFAPATSVTEFVANVDIDVDDLHNFSHHELHVQLLVYISRKYPNLSTLEYIHEGNHCLDYSETNEIIETGWIPLLQRLGPQLKNVSVWFSKDQEGLDETFDRFGCQLNYLYMYFMSYESLSRMAQSKQAFYIQTLVLLIKLPSLGWLKNFRVLKKLDLRYSSPFDQPRTLQLSDILDNAPSTLESLSLHSYSFDIDPSYTGTSNIKTLSFRSMTFDDKVDRFISQCFPQLLELELKRCELHNNRLNLEKTNLASFSYCNDFNRDLLITTLKDNKRRSYDLRTIKHLSEEAFYPQNYRPFKTYPASDINDIVYGLNFTCNSVRNVVFIE